MRAEVVPTLEVMRDVYALAREGGPASPRFMRYLAIVREREGSGLEAFNPMAGAPAAETVEALLALGAERVAREAAAAVHGDGAVRLAVVVASPGLWTDREVTEAEWRLAPRRHDPARVLLWAGEPVDAEVVRAAAAGEAARVAFGPAATVRAALERERVAAAAAGSPGREPLGAAERAAVEAVLAERGGSDAVADVLAVVYGDALAVRLGHPALGLADRAGLRWALSAQTPR